MLEDITLCFNGREYKIDSGALVELSEPSEKQTYTEDEVRRIVKIILNAVLLELSCELSDMADAVGGDYAVGLRVASESMNTDNTKDLIQSEIDRGIKQSIIKTNRKEN